MDLVDGDDEHPVDWVDTVLVKGRVYVSVDDLVESLRLRAVMFADIAMEPVAPGDELVRVAGRAKAEELTSRADALTVAGLELQYETFPMARPPESGGRDGGTYADPE